MDGVIATNTTLARDAVAGLPHAEEAGGLSGAPVREASNRVIAPIARGAGLGLSDHRGGRHPQRRGCQGQDRRGCGRGADLHRPDLPRPGAGPRSSPGAAARSQQAPEQLRSFPASAHAPEHWRDHRSPAQQAPRLDHHHGRRGNDAGGHRMRTGDAQGRSSSRFIGRRRFAFARAARRLCLASTLQRRDALALALHARQQLFARGRPRGRGASSSCSGSLPRPKLSWTQAQSRSNSWRAGTKLLEALRSVSAASRRRPPARARSTRLPPTHAAVMRYGVSQKCTTTATDSKRHRRPW